MAYNSAYTGPQIDEAIGAVQDNKDSWDKAAGASRYYIATATVLNGTVGEITLPEGAEIKDGVIVSFVTPAAGLKMTGIKVGTYTLDIVDGRNRSVLQQAGFFAKDCRVSVILDITNSKAWLQNIAMIHVGDSVINNFGLGENATVNEAFDAAFARSLPTVTASDNGKFLRVVSGAWAAAEISNANGVSF